MERWFEVPSPKKASTSYRYRHIDTDVRLYIFVSFGGVRYREGRHTGGVASRSTHSWRCPAEGAGWPRGSSPHRCCPHSYSAGCRSVSPDANNSHWCSGTCTLHSQGKGGCGDKYKEKRHFFFLSTTISNVWFSEKSCVHSLNNRLEANIISDAPLCNFRGQNVLFIQGLQVFVAFKEWQKKKKKRLMCSFFCSWKQS